MLSCKLKHNSAVHNVVESGASLKDLQDKYPGKVKFFRDGQDKKVSDFDQNNGLSSEGRNIGKDSKQARKAIKKLIKEDSKKEKTDSDNG